MTAVEWLISEILCENKVHMDKEGEWIDDPRTEYINAYKSHIDLSDYVSKALALEEKQTLHFGALCCVETTKKQSWKLQELYNETFKTKQQ
jgi:hypothetical protein